MDSSADSSSSNGFLSGLLGGIQRAANSGLLGDIGMGLLSASHYGANPGESMMQALAAGQQRRLTQQQLQMGQYQMNMMRDQAPLIMQALQGAVPQAGSASPSAPVSSASLSAPVGSAPAQTGQSQAPAQTGQSQDDPWGLIQRGTALQAVPLLSGYGKAMVDRGKTMLENDPQYVTQKAAAGGPIAQNLALLQRYGSVPGLGQGLATSLEEALGQRHIGSMSGIQTYQNPDGSWTTIDPRTGLVTNTNQGTTLLPGAAGAQQTLAGAHAMGEAQGEVAEVSDAQGNKYFVPRSALLGGRGAASPTSAGASPPSRTPFPMMAGIGPGSAEMLHGSAAQAIAVNKEYQDQAENGTAMLAQIQELRNAAHDMGTGKFEPARQEGLNLLNSMGLITPDQSKALGSAQSGTKLAIQLQAAATKQLGSREAAQIFNYMGKSMPNLTLSSDGLEKISSYMEGIARYQQARAQVAQQYQNANDANGLNSVRNTFIEKTNPLYYIVASANPTTQAEIVQSMGAKSKDFLASWKAAVRAGYAPTPQAYWGAQ